MNLVFEVFKIFRTPKSNFGFSLIELLVTLVIVGVLATWIIVKILNIQDDAELSKIESVAADFRNAVKFVQLTFEIQGRTTRVQNLPGFGSENVDTNNIGFPIGIDKGNGNENIGRGNNGCAGVWNGILTTSLTAGTNAANDFQTYRHTSSRVCSYVYRRNGDTNGRGSALLVIQYDSRDGQVYVCGNQAGLSSCPF